MKRTALVLTGLLLGALLSAPAQEAVKEIRVSAKKYEFTPGEIRLQTGQKVRLILTAEDRTHGIEIKDLKIKEKIFKGKETVVEFTAPAPGTYEFKCAAFCGFGHGRMKGRLIVEPAPQP